MKQRNGMTAPRTRTGPSLDAPDLDSAVDALRARGLRVSAARRLVLEALYAADGPITAEQIADGLAGRLPRSDLASVYRNLETLEEVGLVRHFHLGHGPGLYAPSGAGEREYLVCDSCSTVHRRRARGDGARAGAHPGALRLRGSLQPLPDPRALRGLRPRGVRRPKHGRSHAHD